MPDRASRKPSITRLDDAALRQVTGGSALPLPFEVHNAATGGSYVYLGSGNDVVHAGRGVDVLRGNAGNDQLFGEGGDDQLLGGLGDDVLDGGDGNDIIQDDAGNNTVAGGAGSDLIGLGGSASSVVDGGTGNDTIFGTLGNDQITGGEGDDIAVGGHGDDTYIWGPGQGVDQFSGAAGQDTLRLDGVSFETLQQSLTLEQPGLTLHQDAETGAVTCLDANGKPASFDGVLVLGTDKLTFSGVERIILMPA